jgi:hypothetical protein
MKSAVFPRSSANAPEYGNILTMIATPASARAGSLVAFTAPSAQVMAILDAAETVRMRLVLQSATSGDQHGRQLDLLAGELRALRQALRDPKLDSRLSSLGSALALMAEAFRKPGPELVLWCKDVLEVPPRRLANHLDALAGRAYEPVILEARLARHLDRERIARLKRSPLPRRQW